MEGSINNYKVKPHITYRKTKKNIVILSEAPWEPAITAILTFNAMVQFCWFLNFAQMELHTICN